MANLSQLLLALAIAGWIGGFGLASARIAARVERRASVWFAIGALAGPIALLVLRAAPPGRCRTCGAPTRGWHHTCWWCHEDVRSTPASTRAILDRMAARATPDAPPPAPVERSAPARPFVIRTEATRIQATPPTQAPPRPAAARIADAPPPTVPPPPDPPPAAGRSKRRSSRTVPSGDTTERVVTAWSPPAPSAGTPVPPRSTAPVSTAPPAPPANEALQVLATAIFVAGGAGLEPGHRYGLALRSSRLQVLGPIDVDPSVVVVDRAVADVEVRTLEGRLIVSEPQNRSGLVLAFMSVAGPAPSELVAAINAAAMDASRA